ncbi:MAG: hypothetical protein IT361_04320 [Gemmatimonadaceae bacterium]|nr:hypothetical protein [Gemmatimonadaceae bacterium]
MLGAAIQVRQSLAGTFWSRAATDGREALPFDALTRLRFDSDARFSRMACLVLLLPTIWFATADPLLARGDAETFAIRGVLRLALVAALIAGAVLIPLSRTRRSYEARVLGVTLACVTCIVALNALRPLDAGVPLRTPLLWLFALYVGFPTRPSRQFVAPVALTAGLVAIPSFWSAGAQHDSVAGNVLILLTLNVLGMLLVRQRHRLAGREAAWEAASQRQVREERAQRDLRTLKGIIPICAFCKMVHAEDGDWQQVEVYVRARSDAEFSHGVCPTCFSLHYPGHGTPPG